MDAKAKFDESLQLHVVAVRFFLDANYQETGAVVYESSHVAEQLKADAQMVLLALAELVKEGKCTVQSDLYCVNGHHLWSGVPSETQEHMKMECPYFDSGDLPCDHNDGLAENDPDTEPTEKLTYVLKNPPKRWEDALPGLMPQVRKDVTVFGTSYLRFTKDGVVRVEPWKIVTTE